MSEDEGRKAGQQEEDMDEVEAHKRAGVTEEPGDEARKEDDDDFEAHSRPT